jgi:O-acetyl-ADP-ribose deacetylase (regulator of RNase III)
MGSGIAKEIRERYPEAYEADLATVKSDRDKLGTFSLEVVKKADNPFLIVNAYTQYDFAPRDKDHFEYEAFQRILDTLYEKVAHSEDSAKVANELAETRWRSGKGNTKAWQTATKPARQLGGEMFNFGFPYIGMGLAGGDKDRIIAMIEDFAEKVSSKGGSVTLVEFG